MLIDDVDRRAKDCVSQALAGADELVEYRIEPYCNGNLPIDDVENTDSSRVSHDASGGTYPGKYPTSKLWMAAKDQVNCRTSIPKGMGH